MKLSPTLSAYLARGYVFNFLILLFGLMGLIYFFDTVELLRRASKFDDVSFALVLKMGLFKLPEVTQTIFPFAILFSAIFTFWSLTQKLELIIVRAAGFSAFHFLLPIIAVAVFAGLIQMTVVNPIGALMLTHYEKMEKKYLKRERNNIALFQDGLWLKQETDNGYAILNSSHIEQKNWQLVNVTVLLFDQNDTLLKRIDAPAGTLEAGQWHFKDAQIHYGYDQKEEEADFYLPTQLTPQDVEDSFASPETIAFWNLPTHIRILEESGFNPNKLKVHYHVLLARPLMLAAMVLIAAGVAIRLPRSGSAFLFVIAGVFIGLVIFFVSSFMQALGASQQIPVILASWSPALLSLLLGVNLILHLEEE